MMTPSHGPRTDPAPRRQAAADVVEGTMDFLRPQADKPVFHSSALTGGDPEIFFETDTHVVEIADMRPIAGSLSVDREGFKLLRHRSAVPDLYDDDAIARRYYPEIEDLLGARFDADRVIVFDATRRSDSVDGAANPDGARGPAWRAHVDYTVKSGPQRVADILGGEEAERLRVSGTRMIQINVWRPIRGPVRRTPLAVADASTVAPAEIVATDQVFPDRVGEIYQLVHSPNQCWYFARDMTRDEVLLIKGWDSLDDGRARFAPHAAFKPIHTPADAPPRESIEVRTLIIGS